MQENQNFYVFINGGLWKKYTEVAIWIDKNFQIYQFEPGLVNTKNGSSSLVLGIADINQNQVIFGFLKPLAQKMCFPIDEDFSTHCGNFWNLL